MFIEVTAVLVVIVVIAVGGGVLLLRRVNHATSVIERLGSDRAASVEEGQRTLTAAVNSLAESRPRFDSPLTRLSFYESLDPECFAAASVASAREGLTELLAGRVTDGTLITVNRVALTRAGAEMVVSASASGRQLLSEGKVLIPVHRITGARLPQLVDARTGKVIEKLKELPVSTVTARLATISGAIIGAAHLVAGADLAKRLAGVESKLDLLVAFRRIDQIAKLERIYVTARELAWQGMDKDRRLEMWRLRGELRELRSTWRQDFYLRLDQIENPEDMAWLRRFFTPQRSLDQRVFRGITTGQAEVLLIEYSMRIEHILAIGSGTIEAFQLSQESELEELDKLRALIKQKADQMSGKYPELSANAVIGTLAEVVSAYRDILPATIEGDIPTIEPSEPVAAPINTDKKE